jgi:hypothetical protein
MPLPESSARRAVHRRVIDMLAYEREDGLYDIEGHLVDTKPFDFVRPSAPDRAVPSGEALHDLWVRLTLDTEYVVRDVVGSSDITPWAICREAESTLKSLIGERVGRGWSSIVKGRLGGSAGCTHLMEMLMPLATAAFQGIRPLQRRVPELSEQVDTCYAFGRGREVVQVIWPRLHGPPQGGDG